MVGPPFYVVLDYPCEETISKGGRPPQDDGWVVQPHSKGLSVVDYSLTL